MKRISIVLFVIFALIGIVELSSCESFNRELHSMHSDLNGGLYRKVTLLDYEGDTLKVWEGKFDVQFTDRNSAYWDMNGKRVMISGGIIVNEEL